MKTGDLVYFTVPWPVGPKSEIAKITRIGDDSSIKLRLRAICLIRYAFSVDLSKYENS